MIILIIYKHIIEALSSIWTMDWRISLVVELFSGSRRGCSIFLEAPQLNCPGAGDAGLSAQEINDCINNESLHAAWVRLQ